MGRSAAGRPLRRLSQARPSDRGRARLAGPGLSREVVPGGGRARDQGGSAPSCAGPGEGGLEGARAGEAEATSAARSTASLTQLVQVARSEAPFREELLLEGGQLLDGGRGG